MFAQNRKVRRLEFTGQEKDETNDLKNHVSR